MKKYILLLIVSLSWCNFSIAGDLNSFVDKAKTSYEKGLTLETVELLKSAMLSIWNEIPLTAKSAKFVIDNENYQPRKNSKYKVGEPNHITCQVFGYSFKKLKEIYHINIVTDFYLLDKKDTVLGGMQKFGTFDHTSHIQNTDFRLDLTYTITSAPKGEYIIQTIIHDINSDKNTQFKMEIEII